MNPLLPFEWIAALRFLREGRMQSILIVLGVAIGVAVIVFMSALLSGLQSNIVRRTLSAQSHIQVLPPDDVARVLREPGDGGPVTAIVQPKAQRLRSIDQWQKVRDRIEGLPDVVAVSPQVSGPGFAVRGEANKSVTLIGIEPERYLRIVNLADKLVSGAVRVGGGEALIGTELAKDLGIGVGDKFRVSTASGASDTLTVSGLFDLGNKGANQRNLYIGIALAQSMLNLVGGVSSIDVNVREPFAAEDTARAIESETGLKAESWIQTNAQFFTALAAQTFTNRAIRAFVALTVAFGIASVLVVSVVQKSKEIGILRAMGTSRGQVLRLFLIQGGVVGFLGSLLGSAMAYGFLMVWRSVARNADGTPLFILDIEPSLVISTAVGAALVGVLSAVMPARRAAGLDPVVAIRG